MRYCTERARSVVRFVSGILLIFSASAALTQNPVLKTRPKEDQQLNAAHRITLNVQVTDAAGNPVSDLRPDDFSLLDNRQPRRIVAFHSIDGAALTDATEIVILLDAVNTPPESLHAAKDAIFTYLAESRKPLPFPTAFALWFNGHLSATPATTDRNAIGRAFVKLTKNVHSNACGIEQEQTQRSVSASKDRDNNVSLATCRAVHFKDSVAALDGIAKQQAVTGGRTLLIWMGSGWPAELARLDLKQRDAYAGEFARIMHDLRASQMTVYSIGPGDGNSVARDPNSIEPTGTSHEQVTSSSPRIAVDEFALRTGGRVFASNEDLAKALRSCIRDADWYYSLAFNAPPAQNGTRELHSLEIKVNRPDVEIRTLDSYYIEP